MSEATAGRTDTRETCLSVTAAQAAISARLTEASAFAKAALVCAHARSERVAVLIVLDLSEAQTLHGVICLIGRINRCGGEATAPGD